MVNGKVTITKKSITFKQYFPLPKTAVLNKQSIQKISYYRNALAAMENIMVLSKGNQSYLKFDHNDPSAPAFVVAGYFPGWGDTSAQEALANMGYRIEA